MAERLLIALAVALALIGGGYLWGHTATDNAWTARQAKADKAAADELQKETDRADKAVRNYLAEHLDQEERYAELNRVYQNLRTRAPLVVPGSVACRAMPGPHQAPTPDEWPGASIAGGGPYLTLAAVRMWNGALTGTDAPAGACGPAGATTEADAACAEASGLIPR